MKSVATHRGGMAHSVTAGPHRQHSVILWVSRAILPGQCLLTRPRVTSNCPQLRAWPTSLRTTAANSPSRTTLVETGLSPTGQCHNVPGCLRLNPKGIQFTHYSMENMTAIEMCKTRKSLYFPSQKHGNSATFYVLIGYIIEYC